MQFSENNALVASARLPDGKASQPALWAKATKTGTFYQQHLWLPLTGFAVLSVLLMDLGADQWLADRIYVAGGHAWVLQSNPLVEGIIHEGGRQASKWAWIAVAVCLLLALAPGLPAALHFAGHDTGGGIEAGHAHGLPLGPAAVRR